MDCKDAAPHLLAAARGTLPPDVAPAVLAHLETCERCRRQRDREAALDVALEALPTPRMSARREESLRSRYAAPPRRRGWQGGLVAAVALACAAILVVAIRGPTGAVGPGLVDEAVNDHLRQLYREAPLEVASGGIHQVKPWFAGRLDFAPVLHFEGDDTFPLQGGAVAYFIDRKAALFAYKRNLHPISLLVLEARGLPFGALSTATARGFNVISWREADLGYVLVSDLNPAELLDLAHRIRGDAR